MKVKGIKRGQTIELLQEIDIPDGSEIIVEVELPHRDETKPPRSLTQAEKLTRLNQIFGSWQDQPELIEVFAEINRERHNAY